MFTLNGLISISKVSVFELTIKDWFKDYFQLIQSNLLALALVKCITFLLDTEYIKYLTKTLITYNDYELHKHAYDNIQ